VVLLQFKAEYDDGSEIEKDDITNFNLAIKGTKPDRIAMFDGENIVIVSLSDYSIYVGDCNDDGTLDLGLTQVEQDTLISNGCSPVIFSRVTINKGMNGDSNTNRIYVIGFKSGEVERYAALNGNKIEVWKSR
jgi:hypothetical protein